MRDEILANLFFIEYIVLYCRWWMLAEKNGEL